MTIVLHNKSEIMYSTYERSFFKNYMKRTFTIIDFVVIVTFFVIKRIRSISVVVILILGSNNKS